MRVARGNIRPRVLDSGSGPRPTRFGEIWAIDHFVSGQQQAITIQDLFSGVLWVKSASNLGAREVIAYINYLFSFGITIEGLALLSDRAKVFLESIDFQEWLEEKSVHLIPSKGYDPTHIASLERAHLEMGVWVRSLPESERSVWGEGFWDEFLYGFNHSETECGLSRSELAWGVGLGRNQEIAVRLKTLHSSVQDAKKMEKFKVFTDTLVSGRKVRVLPRSTVLAKKGDRGEIVEVLECFGPSTLVRGSKGARYVPSRLLRPLGPGVEGVDGAVHEQRGNLDQKYEEKKLHQQQVAEDELVEVKVGDWVVYRSLGKVFLGVSTSVGEDFVEIQEIQQKQGVYTAVWRSGDNRKMSQSPGRTWRAEEWKIRPEDVVFACSRGVGDQMWTPPLQVLEALAMRDRMG